MRGASRNPGAWARRLSVAANLLSDEHADGLVPRELAAAAHRRARSAYLNVGDQVAAADHAVAAASHGGAPPPAVTVEAMPAAPRMPPVGAIVRWDGEVYRVRHVDQHVVVLDGAWSEAVRATAGDAVFDVASYLTEAASGRLVVES